MINSTWCSGMGAGGWILMTAFWVALLVVIVWAVTRLFPNTPKPDPLEVLDRRLAAGEIDSEAYQQARAALTGAARPHAKV